MISDNISRIKERIPSSVTLVAVSKGRTVQQIKEALEAGVDNIGENKVQEASTKYKELNAAITWHMVGHLQTNKVKEAVKIFDLIQSVDSLHLAVEIDKQAAKIGKAQDVLIEIKTSFEAEKFGLKPEEAMEAIKEMRRLKNINIKGLMTIAPMVSNPEDTRPYFRALRETRDRINDSGVIDKGLEVLSMGMTDDFEVAIAEGSNMVRLGRAIFEG